MADLVAAGIDVGQRFLDLGLAPSGQTTRYRNEPSDIARLVERLAQGRVARVVLEAIGSYAQPLVLALVEAGLSVGVVNPRRIKAFREAEGGRAKTDRLDARLIARFARAMPEAIRPLPDATARALKELSTRRQQLVAMRAVEKTRLQQAREPAVLESHRACIASLDAACAAIEAELDARIRADAARLEAQRLLVSIPGIGPRVAGVLICDLPELGQRDRKSIASLAGLAPHVSQSGNAPPRAMIGGGRPCVRAALYMSALVAVRHDPHFKASYRALRDQGKPAKLALIAVARRILITANAVLKTKTPYQSQNTP
ncbi:IS110 family transposase [Methylobacterium sp. J-030]|uniref:IS110 family transposase n=1 Tax=Methylobacterium sp. J-030 TaxID=2836627 RepID=UPI001FBB8FDD|nr:IS110 family transposase [Methylobacterium sp. J-030]MCJ2071221.1 IS110 family transposase [Methylobacterium sp. J-030]